MGTLDRIYFYVPVVSLNMESRYGLVPLPSSAEHFNRKAQANCWGTNCRRSALNLDIVRVRNHHLRKLSRRHQLWLDSRLADAIFNFVAATGLIACFRYKTQDSALVRCIFPAFNPTQHPALITEWNFLCSPSSSLPSQCLWCWACPYTATGTQANRTPKSVPPRTTMIPLMGSCPPTRRRVYVHLLCALLQSYHSYADLSPHPDVAEQWQGRFAKPEKRLGNRFCGLQGQLEPGER